MKIETGERLGIVYTADSLLVVTPKDGHTSVVIAKQEKELLCTTLSPMPTDGKAASFFGQIVLSIIITDTTVVFTCCSKSCEAHLECY